jgi:hypothetical protein
MKKGNLKRLKIWSFLLIFSFSILIPTPLVSAIPDEMLEFFAENDIIGFDPSGLDIACSNMSETGTNTATDTLSQRQNLIARHLWNGLAARNLGPISIAGILGNWRAESALDPARKQSNSTKALTADDNTVGFGLAQWTLTGYKQVLFPMMEAAGLGQYFGEGFGDYTYNMTNIPDDDLFKLLDVQLAYFYDNANPLLWVELESQASPGDAAIKFLYSYEKPANGPATQPTRVTFANEFFVTFNSFCGAPLKDGGMTLEEATTWYEGYRDLFEYYQGVAKNTNGDREHYSLRNPGCTGGTLNNCVALSQYFVNRYVLPDNHIERLPNGGQVVGTLVTTYNKHFTFSNTPQPYAIFSYGGDDGSGGDNGSSLGHTGVILGIEGNQIIYAQAGCGAGKTTFGNIPDLFLKANMYNTALKKSVSFFESRRTTYAIPNNLNFMGQ